VSAVVGLDLSLTATGIADGSGVRTIKTNLRGCERLIFVRDHIAHVVRDSWHYVPGPPLVVIEDYAYHGRHAHSHQLGELGGVVRVALHEAAVPWVAVVPSTLKRYATGKGNAPKVQMVTSARERLAYAGHDDNEADALWLRALGMDLLGAPLVDLPKTHRAALDKVALPEGVAL